MIKPIIFSGIEISEKKPPLVIPEIGINHSGNIEAAFKIVDSAKRAGAKIIKHQTHIPEDEMSFHAKKIKPGNSKKYIYDIISECSLSEEDEFKLMKYVISKNLVFLSTPFSRKSVDRLIKFNVQAFKVGSGEFNNLPLLDYICKFKKPMLVSTGMADLKECKQIYGFLKKRKVNFCFLHTTSLYPTPNKLVRLGAITQMKNTFKDIMIGFSDHTTDNLSSYAATALGARIIERHFSDKKRKGPDIISSNFEQDLELLIKGTKKIFEQSSGLKTKLKEEEITRKFAYASIIATQDISKNEKFSIKNIWAKRPGTGNYLAKDFYRLLNKRSKRVIKKGHQIKKSDIK
jgi:N-acetylneuraminate synthase